MEEQIMLEECPICRGAGMIMHEGGWSVQVECVDCSAHTVYMEYDNDDDNRNDSHHSDKNEYKDDSPSMVILQCYRLLLLRASADALNWLFIVLINSHLHLDLFCENAPQNLR